MAMAAKRTKSSSASGPRSSPAPRAARADEVSLGRVMAPFGYHGELRLFLNNPDSELLAEPRSVVLVLQDGRRVPLTLSARPGAGRRVIGRASGVSTEAEALALTDAEILIARADLPPPEEGAWYHHDLLGTPVRTADGRALGRVAEIHSQGGTDVWVLRGAGPERYLPVLRALLVEVKPGERIVVRDDADGEEVGGAG